MSGGAMMSGVLAPVAKKLIKWEGRKVEMQILGPADRSTIRGTLTDIFYCEDGEAFECETCGMQSDMLLMFYVDDWKVFDWERNARVLSVSKKAVMFELGDERISIDL